MRTDNVLSHSPIKNSNIRAHRYSVHDIPHPLPRHGGFSYKIQILDIHVLPTCPSLHTLLCIYISCPEKQATFCDNTESGELPPLDNILSRIQPTTYTIILFPESTFNVSVLFQELPISISVLYQGPTISRVFFQHSQISSLFSSCLHSMINSCLPTGIYVSKYQ
jgi:hypothetical protein